MAFFATRLLAGHVVGRNNPSGAIGLFVGTDFVKVVGFAVVLFILGAPAWLHARWFLIGAVVLAVLIVGALMVFRAESHTNKVALTAEPKPVSYVEAKSAQFRASRTYVGTLQPGLAAKHGPTPASPTVPTATGRPGARQAPGAAHRPRSRPG